jgi:hypothetical protein
MLVHEFDDLMESVPFRPFRVYTADGRSVRVSDPRLAWHAPAERTVIIATGTPGRRRKHIIDLHLVSRFTVEGEGREGGNGNGKKRRK